MAQGPFEVTGTLDLNQFWPSGESDGDTTKVVVKAGAFRFRRSCRIPEPPSMPQTTSGSPTWAGVA